MIKKILSTIFEPFRNFGSKNISEKITNFLKDNTYIIYIISIIITLIIIIFTYFI